MSSPRRQRGIALLLLVAALAMGATWYMVKRLRELSLNNIAADRDYNAQVLSRAKQALIGYVVAQANKTGENNPGNIPCPEAPGSFNQTNGTDGRVDTSGCTSATVPAVGRYPWRTIGTEQLKDAAGEPLWYVVSPGWAITSVGANTVINSNSTGQLTIDGVSPATQAAGDTVIALIIAPGPAINVPASSGCTAWSQSRPATAGAAPDWRNYLECENATNPADVNFVTSGPSGAFNDQVVKVTVSDLMPGLEAAIADRIQREVVPALKTVYAATGWGLTGSNVIYPFAAPFSNPSTSAAEGVAGTYAGLLPMNYAETSPTSGTLCTASAGAPRCDPNFVAWSGTPVLSGASIYVPSCSATASQVSCTFDYWCLLVGCSGTSLAFTLNATAQNVGMAMRQLYPAVAMTNVDTAGRSVSATMNADGSAALTLSGSTSVSGSGSPVSNAICGISGLLALFFDCRSGSLAVPITLLADHSLLDSSIASSYGWFVRNKWNELTYYATVSGYSPAVRPAQPACTTGVDCVSVANVAPSGGQRAILILAGRSINGSTRPSATLSDYLDFGNATGAYEKQTVSRANAPALKRPFNDRIVVVDTN